MSLLSNINTLRRLMVSNLNDAGVTDATSTMGLTTLTNKIKGLGVVYPETYNYYVSDTLGSDTNTGTSKTVPFKTVSKALSVMNDYESVLIMEGTYTGDGVNCNLIIRGNVKIFGVKGKTLLDGEDTYRSGFVSPTGVHCLLQGLTFQNGYANNGGGVYNGSSNTVTDCTFSNNASSNGGGVFNLGNSNTVTDCTFTSNNASYNGGGVYSNDNNNNISYSSFKNNTPQNIYVNGSYSGTITYCYWNTSSPSSSTYGTLQNYTVSNNITDSKNITGTINISTTSTTNTEKIEINGQFLDIWKQPINNLEIKLYNSNNTLLGTTTTNTNGKAYFTQQPTANTTYKLISTATTNYNKITTSTVTVSITTGKTPVRLKISTDKTSLTTDTAIITGTITTNTNTVISSASIILKENNKKLTTLTSDTIGTITYTYTPTLTGENSLQLYYAGDSTYTSKVSSTITVTKS